MVFSIDQIDRNPCPRILLKDKCRYKEKWPATKTLYISSGFGVDNKPWVSLRIKVKQECYNNYNDASYDTLDEAIIAFNLIQ